MGTLRRRTKRKNHPLRPEMSERELSLFQHLSELRRRVVISVLALLVGSAVSFAFFRQLIELLVRPARDLETGIGGQLVYTEVTELLTTSFKCLSLLGSCWRFQSYFTR